MERPEKLLIECVYLLKVGGQGLVEWLMKRIAGRITVFRI